MSESNLFHPIEGVKSYAKQHPLKAGLWVGGIAGTVWLANTIPLGCNVIGGGDDAPDSVQAVDCQVDKQGTVEVGDTLKKVTVQTAAGRLGEISLGYFKTEHGGVAMSSDKKTAPVLLAEDGVKIHTEHGMVKVKQVSHFGDPAIDVHCPPRNS